jgi:uncharacterized protein YjbI with pentapeptide repeats
MINVVELLKKHNEWIEIRNTIAGEDLKGVNLQEADFKRVNLAGINLSEANLRSVDFCEANLAGANLSGANLRDADLREANLAGANLSGANLQDANLREANLVNAILIGANLKDANLLGANLQGANFKDANLEKVICNDVNFQNKIYDSNISMNFEDIVYERLENNHLEAKKGINIFRKRKSRADELLEQLGKRDIQQEISNARERAWRKVIGE